MKRLATLPAACLLLAAGCSSSHHPATKADPRDWLAGNALALRLMHGHAANLELVLGDAAQVSAQAPPLTAAVAAAERTMPAPDATLSRLLHDAAEDYGQGAVESLNPGRTAVASSYLARGDHLFRKAVERSEALGRSIYAGT